MNCQRRFHDLRSTTHQRQVQYPATSISINWIEYGVKRRYKYKKFVPIIYPTPKSLCLTACYSIQQTLNHFATTFSTSRKAVNATVCASTAALLPPRSYG